MSDFSNRIEQAKGILPLSRLMDQYGKGPGNGKGKCPYCGKKGGFGIFGKGSEERFKCHHVGCSSGTAEDGKAWDAIGFLGNELALSRKDAAVVYLKQAGLWQEKERSPSIMPGKGGRKNKLPSDLDVASKTVPREGASTVARPDTAAASSNLASGEKAPRDLDRGESDSRVGTPDATLVPAVGVGSGSDPVRSERSKPAAGETLSDGERKISGPVPDIVGAKIKPDEGDASGGQPSGKKSPTEPNLISPGAGAVSAEGENSNLPADGAPPSAAGSPISNIVTMTGQPVATPAVEPPKVPGGFVVELAPGTQAMHGFFTRLSLSEADEKLLFEKRGLASRTSQALQFKSNPKANKEILLALSSEFQWEELYAAGLWLREDRKLKKERRPNAKFYGFGIAGKKSNGDWDYKWNNPIIIPYFDETGKLLSLRPHKDMGPGGTLTGTPHVYIPRQSGSVGTPSPTSPEIFETVVITEGEFKAAALWQIIGAGRDDGKTPTGVAALPGISFGKNYETREELDGWLRRVKCRCVKVIYDNEEKGDPKFKEAYKSDRRKRFDAQIWARYLATDIAQKLHIRGEVGVLPNDWRNEKGKADWDGAMAQFAKQAA